MKISFVAQCVVDDDTLASYRRRARGLGLPEIGQSGPLSVPLAVVGGAPDVVNYIDELAQWPGDVWAINHTADWCWDNGIDAALYTIDSVDDIVSTAERSRRAVLADSVHPRVFDACSNVTLARTGIDAIIHDTTSAATAPMIAAEAGYSKVVFFGCGGSFDGPTHINKDVAGNRLLIRCGGAEYLTAPDLLMQTDFLSEVARAANGWIEVRGSGFLSALIEHGDYDVIAASRGIHDALEAENGESC